MSALIVRVCLFTHSIKHNINNNNNNNNNNNDNATTNTNNTTSGMAKTILQ